MKLSIEFVGFNGPVASVAIDGSIYAAMETADRMIIAGAVGKLVCKYGEPAVTVKDAEGRPVSMRRRFGNDMYDDYPRRTGLVEVDKAGAERGGVNGMIITETSSLYEWDDSLYASIPDYEDDAAWRELVGKRPPRNGGKRKFVPTEGNCPIRIVPYGETDMAYAVDAGSNGLHGSSYRHYTCYVAKSVCYVDDAGRIFAPRFATSDIPYDILKDFGNFGFSCRVGDTD